MLRRIRGPAFPAPLKRKVGGVQKQPVLGHPGARNLFTFAGPIAGQLPANPASKTRRRCLGNRKDHWLRIFQRFVLFERKEAQDADGKTFFRESLIFPRFHQWEGVSNMVEAVRLEGSGQPYLIQHSAGSGKTHTIAWLVHALIRIRRFAAGEDARNDARVDEKSAKRALAKWLSLHPTNVSQKVELIIEHFRANVAHLLGGQAKAGHVVQDGGSEVPAGPGALLPGQRLCRDTGDGGILRRRGEPGGAGRAICRGCTVQ